MKIRQVARNRYSALLVGALLLTPLQAIAGGPIGATLQTKGNASQAVEGGTDPALISVVVTHQNGKAATNFGKNGTELPPGWVLVSGFNQPVGGCGLSPTHFTNEGGGVYTIEVVPPDGCLWVAGEYHYVVLLDKDVKLSGKKLKFRGRTLGSLEIPAAP